MPIAAFAADSVGRLSGGGSVMDWQLNALNYDSITLRVVSPSGEVFAKEFKSGKAVQLRLSDLGELEEGSYTYELSVSPTVSGDVKSKLAKARAAGDDSAARKIMKDAGLSFVSQTGTVTVANRAFVFSGLVESDSNDISTSARKGPITVNDQVIPDDLIVQGSACVGLDCVNNENFGFDTIRLKENNLRIHFDDTSTQAGFPANDWRLVANDSASGGSSKFSIEDSTSNKTPFTITAGAATNSIFADSTGRIGLRTSTPVLDLHINTSNTPAIRLEQNNSGGFTAQTWDIGANEANFFVRDVTGGSLLPFRIRPGAPTSSLDVSSDGDVGLGTGSPGTNLHVFSTATTDAQVGLGPSPHLATGPGFFFSYSGAGIARGVAVLDTRPDASAVAPNPSIRILTADVQAMIIDNQQFIGLGTTTNPDAPIHYTNGANQARLTTAGAWQDASSREAKENIYDLEAEEALKTLRELKPVHFVYKVLPTDGKVGFIAEDVPEMVATPERQNLSALDIVAVVTKVVQEQQKTIDQLNQRIAQLEQERQQ
ncbi:MAG TPA: tail fiber domain-containing protein [Thermoanaerobaculia bacterium]|jgi:hypothetical protein|nr:tail fiber domain-containing protein [Thermoanaerobaculia bacterium]